MSLRIERIYEAYEEYKKPITKEFTYKESKRTDKQALELREFLLELYDNPKIAKFVKDRRVHQSLYDPDPNSETGWYLDWHSDGKRVQFIYQQPVWGMGRGGSQEPFEIINGRFYANDKEIVDVFPKLTATTLERAIKKHFADEREFRIKHDR